MNMSFRRGSSSIIQSLHTRQLKIIRIESLAAFRNVFRCLFRITPFFIKSFGKNIRLGRVEGNGVGEDINVLATTKILKKSISLFLNKFKNFFFLQVLESNIGDVYSTRSLPKCIKESNQLSQFFFSGFFYRTF